MSDNITITIDDREIQAQPGQMLIEVADANNITIPRFCYHRKLSVAANCRMCLVEVEKAPKPLPACATPCNDGMVVHTRSAQALAAQKSTMEFLLINHPLDCPICDQGGECELQDVAMGFGGDVSQYVDAKRVVREKNIGPLIATDMTRCIHCTRCVRFGEEVAGLPELGATGRGERMEIGTYIEKSVTSELSGNVIDLCPVGALTAKPSRYTARPWELVQHASIAAHDCVGSNIFVHTRNQKVMRVAPRDNEQINEAWISDRDRFSYTAVNSPARLTQPLLRENGKLKAIDWETALQLAVDKLQAAANNSASLAGLIGSSCTLEEHYLFQKLMAGLGSQNMDHRSCMADDAVAAKMPLMPWLGRSIASLERLDSVLLIASDLRQEQPILNHRLRKAVLNNQAQVASIHSLSGQFNFDLIADLAGSAESQVHDLAGVAVAVAAKTKLPLSASLQTLLEKVKAKKEHNAIAKALIDGEQSAVMIGSGYTSLPQMALVMQLAESIADMSGATLGYLSSGANASGACLAGTLPHRGVAGVEREAHGENTAAILTNEHQVLLTMDVNPLLDLNAGTSASDLGERHDFIIAIDTLGNEFNQQQADLVLPLSSWLESSGTFVNIEGLWQSFGGCADPVGASRPGWKILTALAQLLLPNDDFSYNDSTQLRNELKEQCRDIQLNNLVGLDSGASKLPSRSRSVQQVSSTVAYAIDELTRHSSALQATENVQTASSLRLNSAQAEKMGLSQADQVHVQQEQGGAALAVMLDENVPSGCVCVPSGIAAVSDLSQAFGNVTVEKL